MKMRALVVSIVGCVVTCSALLPSHSSPLQAEPEKPTVVFAHGAFADASSWNGVIKILTHDRERGALIDTLV